MSNDDWEVVTSVAAVAAAAVSLIALWLSQRQVRTNLTQQRSEPIRARLAEIARLATSLASRVENHRPIVSASWHQAEILATAAAASHAGDVPAFLVGSMNAHGRAPDVYGALLQGWERSPGGQAFRTDTEALDIASTALHGEIVVVRHAAAILTAIAKNVEMEMINVFGDDDLEFRQAIAAAIAEKGADDVTATSTVLIAGASGLVAAKAHVEISALGARLVRELVDGIDALPAQMIVRLAAEPTPVTATTPAAMVAEHVLRLREAKVVSGAVADRLTAILDVIARLTADPASDQLRRRAKELSSAL